jgi:UPF0755 protein
MTEYGRGLGSQPWYPEDPLYGDQGWSGQQHYPPPPASGGGAPAPQWPQHSAPPPPGHPPSGWGDTTDTSQFPGLTYGDPGDPYGRPPSYDPYGGGNPDPYGAQGAYPPPQQPYQAPYPHTRQQYPEPPQHRQAFEAPGPGEGHDLEHGFFADDRVAGIRDDEDAYDEPEGTGRVKRRSGMACLLTTVILAGLVGGGGYFGYSFWQEHFGPAPDFSGQGSGQVQVEIPEGATGSEMGAMLMKKGVVKSVGAFIEAQKKNPKGDSIQPGVYLLRKQMSGEAAVAMMTDPASLSSLIVAEGWRSRQVYAAIDKKLGLKAGTTRQVAKKQAGKLGLPDWADDDPKIKDPLEGFLYPSRYSAAKGTRPEDVLRQMVARANAVYDKLDLREKARKAGLKSPLDVVTVASLVQAEGKTHDDFRKMADVVYNRLKPGNSQTNGKLEFDSTYNYAKNQSKINIRVSDIRNFDDPYNTYFYRGLPPGPIGNPGEEALQAALDPDKGGWYYFVSIDGKTTFAKTLAEHNRLVEKFNESQRKNGG